MVTPRNRDYRKIYNLQENYNIYLDDKDLFYYVHKINHVNWLKGEMKVKRTLTLKLALVQVYL